MGLTQVFERLLIKASLQVDLRQIEVELISLFVAILFLQQAGHIFNLVTWLAVDTCKVVDNDVWFILGVNFLTLILKDLLVHRCGLFVVAQFVIDRSWQIQESQLLLLLLWQWLKQLLRILVVTLSVQHVSVFKHERTLNLSRETIDQLGCLLKLLGLDQGGQQSVVDRWVFWDQFDEAVTLLSDHLVQLLTVQLLLKRVYFLEALVHSVFLFVA